MSVTTKARKPSQKQVEKQEAIDHLRNVLKPGDRIYGIVRTVSRSGMSRTIDFYAFQDNDRVYLSGWIATALGYSRTDQGALKVQGAGMDMVFSVVYNLGWALFPQGFGIPCEKCGERASTPDHAALMSNRGAHVQVSFCPKSETEAHEFYGRNGDRSGWDTNGGYALKAESL